MKFKLDSGADFSVLSEETYKALESKKALQNTQSVLSGPKGEFNTETVQKGRIYTLRLYAIRGENVNNLLSHPVYLTMGLMKRVYEVSTNT